MSLSGGSLTRAARITRTVRRPVVARPLLDGMLAFALCTIAVSGLQGMYGGSLYLVDGAVGALLGVGIAALGAQRRMVLAVDLLAGGACYFLLAGFIGIVAVPGGGPLPTPAQLSGLAGLISQGWKDILTTVPPVGNNGGLLAVPYLLGIFGGISAMATARRTTSRMLPVASPFVVLVLSILFGNEVPVALLVQGSLFAALALVWMTIRERRNLPRQLTARRWGGRARSALAVLVTAGLLGALAGPHLPFGGRQRTVLSRYVVPPFDVSAQSSPLSAFRSFVPGTPHSFADTILWTVGGVVPAALLPIARMDAYDGVAYGFGGEGGASATGGAESFRHFVSTLPPAAAGGTHGVLTVTVHGLTGLWLPDIGQVTSVDFSGGRADLLSAGFYYNSVTDTAADTAGLQIGDAYTMGVVVPLAPTQAELDGASAGTEVLDNAIPTALQTAAVSWSASASGPWARVLALAGHLKSNGYYSDGTEPVPRAVAGHSTGRLLYFLQGDQGVNNALVGDDEQFAATLALMGNALGVPSRVVLGAQVEPNGVVKGKDVHAWVEVSLSGLGWVAVPPSLFLPTRSAPAPQPQPQQQEAPQALIPPPSVSALRPPPPQPLSQPSAAGAPTGSQAGSSHLPGWLTALLTYAGPPVLLVLLACGLVLGAKRLRRRRRRRRSTYAGQISGAWSELLDFLLDAGATRGVPSRATRLQAAQAFGGLDLAPLAVGADAAVFAPEMPSAGDAADYWQRVDRACTSALAGTTLLRRLRAHLNIASLRARR